MVSDVRMGELLVLASAVLWSLGGVFIKYVSLPSATIIFYRAVIGSVALALVVRRWRHPFTAVVPLSMAGYAGAVIFYVAATNLTTAGAAVMLQFTSPVWVLLLAVVFLGERVRGENLAALVLCMAGIYFFFRGEVDPSRVLGNAIAVLSGVSFAVLYVCYRYLKGYDPAFLVLLGTVTSGVLIAPFAYDKLAVAPWQLGVLAVMALVQLTLPYVLFSRALKVVPAQEASLIGLVEPVLNPIWVWFVVGEILTTNMLIGGALILVALLVRFVRRPKIVRGARPATAA